MIDFNDICKSYGKQDIFDHVSFRINQGERVGIVGPNGTGKTTLFQILSGEVSPDKGDVVIPFIEDHDKLMKVCDAAIDFFADHANAGERFKFTIDRVGADKFEQAIREAYENE